MAILLHKTFPTTNQEFHEILEMTFTTSSGTEVPKATMVSQIIRSERLNLLAKDDAPSTSISAHLMRKKKPITNNIYTIDQYLIIKEISINHSEQLKIVVLSN